MKNVKLILLAGGRGERLWPQSTINNPKPFSVSLNKKTLFQHTLERFSFLEKNSIHICIEKKLKKKILKQDPLFPAQNMIYEPIGRDTAPSVFLSNLSLEKSESVLIFAPCDHFIENQEGFRETIEILVKTAINKNSICLIGLSPKNPSTEFGYIEINNNHIQDPHLSIKKFHEKPDLTTAKKYIQQGNFLWNSGIFACVHSKLDEICFLHEPFLYKNLQEFLKRPQNYPFEEKIERCSFDKKILEIHPQLYCVPAVFDWDDVGSWNSINKYFTKDSQGNSANTEVTFDSSKNTFCFNTEKKLIVIHGCENLNIINQKNVLYISPKDHQSKLKELLKILKKDYPTYL